MGTGSHRANFQNGLRLGFGDPLRQREYSSAAAHGRTVRAESRIAISRGTRIQGKGEYRHIVRISLHIGLISLHIVRISLHIPATLLIFS